MPSEEILIANMIFHFAASNTYVKCTYVSFFKRQEKAIIKCMKIRIFSAHTNMPKWERAEHEEKRVKFWKVNKSMNNHFDRHMKRCALNDFQQILRDNVCIVSLSLSLSVWVCFCLLCYEWNGFCFAVLFFLFQPEHVHCLCKLRRSIQYTHTNDSNNKNIAANTVRIEKKFENKFPAFNVNLCHR